MSFNDRSGALIELLGELNEKGFQYVLVGGYAVSAFNTRFSTDLDVVVAPDNKEKFADFLESTVIEAISGPRRSRRRRFRLSETT